MTFFLNSYPPISCWSEVSKNMTRFPQSPEHEKTRRLGVEWCAEIATRLSSWVDIPSITDAKTSHLSNSTVSSITEHCHTDLTMVSIINCVKYSFCSKENLKSITIGHFIENINSFWVKVGLVNSLLPQTNKITRMQKFTDSIYIRWLKSNLKLLLNFQ